MKERIAFLFRKYRFVILASFLIAWVYFLLRLYHITDLPIFNDEAIYVRWAQLGVYDPSARLISLSDGKQPLFMWLTSLMMMVISHPLYAGRMVSVLSGFATMVGLFFLAKTLFDSTKTAFLSAFLFALFPASVLYNRFALIESLLGALIIWSMWGQVTLVKTLRTSVAFALTYLMGAAILTKMNGFFTLLLLPLSLVFFTKKNVVKRGKIIRLISLAFISVVGSLLFSAILLLSKYYPVIQEKNHTFLITSYHGSIRQIGLVIGQNLLHTSSWTLVYFTPLLIVALVFGFVDRSRRREQLFLLSWFAIPTIIVCALSDQLFPRYLYPSMLVLVPLVAVGAVYLVGRFGKKAVAYGILTLLVILTVDGLIVFDLPHAPIPAIELEQYANGWPSGEGMKEIVQILAQASEGGNRIAIITEGEYASLPTTVVDLFFWQQPNVVHRSLDSFDGKVPEAIAVLEKTMPVYVITNRIQTGPVWPNELVYEKRKGIGDTYVRLYRLTDAEEKINK